MMSLRTKLLILFIVLALIPLGIAGRKLIGITKDELKSSANNELLSVAGQIAQDIEETYVSTWLAPLRLIKESVDSKDLGVNEKLSLLMESMKHITDFVSLQISVEGIASPLLVIQDDFSDQIRKASLNPNEILVLSPEKIASLEGDEIFVEDVTFVSEANFLLITVILPLDYATFDRRATLSARINLYSLLKRIDEHYLNTSGFLALFDGEGRQLSNINRIDLSSHSLVQTARELIASNIKTSGVEPYVNPSGKRVLGAYAFPDYLNWGVVAEKNEKDAYAAADQMQSNLLLWVFIGLIVAVLGGVFFSVSLTSPLIKLTGAAKSLASGDLQVKVEGDKRKDEIGHLSLAFNKMVADLNRYIDELTETTKAKERAESELKLAWKIQSGFLPKHFPELEEMDVWGMCEPAREVGGDYFDFFQIDKDRYALVIGDVSGKGVPAALFMAVSRTLFRILVSQYPSPEKVLTMFNNKLVELDQGSNMFISIFYGMYNVKTGELLYSSAGHNMPYVRYASPPDHDPQAKSDGEFHQLPPVKTLIAGMIDGFDMELVKTKLTKGDILFLYTDGITEPINTENEEFGEERLESLLEKYSNLPLEDMCTKLVHEVSVFQQGMPQFDDMTVLAIRVK